jgi:hypothetical protein
MAQSRTWLRVEDLNGIAVSKRGVEGFKGMNWIELAWGIF